MVVDTWAQGRMVDKVRTKPGEARNAAARNESRAVVATWVWGVCIYLPGHDRRGNLGALPGVSTSGFHASRFALASRNLQPGASNYVALNLRLYVYLTAKHLLCQYLLTKLLRTVEYFLLNS